MKHRTRDIFTLIPKRYYADELKIVMDYYPNSKNRVKKKKKIKGLKVKIYSINNIFFIQENQSFSLEYQDQSKFL